MKFASLISTEVVKMTTRSAASDKISSKWRHFRFSVWHNTNLHNTATNATLTTSITATARPAAAWGDNPLQLTDVGISITRVSTGVISFVCLLVDRVVVTSKFILIYTYCITLSFSVKRNISKKIKNRQTENSCTDPKISEQKTSKEHRRPSMRNLFHTPNVTTRCMVGSSQGRSLLPPPQEIV